MKKLISIALILLTATTMAIVTGCEKKEEPAAPKIPDAPEMPAAPKDHPAH